MIPIQYIYIYIYIDFTSKPLVFHKPTCKNHFFFHFKIIEAITTVTNWSNTYKIKRNPTLPIDYEG
jgi:hypothetical protein